MGRVRPSHLVGLVCVLIALLVTGAEPAVGSRGSDPFVPGRTYTGDFPDPGIVRAGDTYYVYSTNTANLNLPTMTSQDLETWTAYGDAFPAPELGAHAGIGGRSVSRTWAPSVTKVGDHFVLAYTAPIDRGGPRKNCVGLAESDSPEGPFRDPHGSPMVCPSDQGAIDPQVFVDTDAKPYLIWKTEGRKGCCSTKFWSRQLDQEGVDFADGSQENELLSTALSWEGHVIENPYMIRVNGLLYVFYSANEYVSSAYAIGYAICQSVAGPCERPSSEPLMASGDKVSGPGGPAPFIGPDGQLRMAYAAWSFGRVGYPRSSRCGGGCNQRRLHIARLSIDVDGLVHVTDRG